MERVFDVLWSSGQVRSRELCQQAQSKKQIVNKQKSFQLFFPCREFPFKRSHQILRASVYLAQQACYVFVNYNISMGGDVEWVMFALVVLEKQGNYRCLNGECV